MRAFTQNRLFVVRVFLNVGSLHILCTASKKEKQFTVGPVVLAFFLFVVVGSSLLQVT